ncbi:MAG TPA: MarC family protein [Gemmatales bacterium]|nr:MarC family protein [Gemmatales bacterium]HMP59667.1 MarC family protein [Gemmatales bacterium]
MSVVSATVLCFLVIDPIGNIPFFVSALQRVPPERQGWVVRRELLIAYGLMVLFLFLGGPLLRILGISEPALTLAGGVILFLIALRMVFPTPEKPLFEGIDEEPFIVPLAVPYVAGPSVLATELLFMSKEPDRWPEWLLAITLAWAGCAAILLGSTRLRGLLGTKGLVALERLMGMVLIALAVQMFLTGVEAFLAARPRAP